MKKVLIIEDSPQDSAQFSKVLDKMGYTVFTASNGEEGVEKATKEIPDLILMDVVMPKMNGFQAARALNKNDETKDIPVIMVTTKSQETDKIWARRQGVKIFMTKPVGDKDLKKAVKEVMGD